MKKVSIVIPAFNEASNIGKLYSELFRTLSLLPNYQFEIIFVDDGSSDLTLKAITDLASTDPRVFYIELSRNFGHQAALKAGLDVADGDCVITMDSDLQHPPEMIVEMIEAWESGFDIVFTKRIEDNQLPLFKRMTSKLYYFIYNRLSDVKLETGAADFRLMGRNAREAFSNFTERDLFIRGLVTWSGFRQKAISYVANERYSGKTKYSVYKMISLALKGITSFSTRPLKLIAYIGIFFFLISLVLVPYVLISYLYGHTTEGWTSLITTVFFFGSLQLLMLGIISVYLGKIVIESKNRPLYFIRNSSYPPKIK
ncbi:MAG TPA: glycosyltransferase family 2 protein [Chryseosolibacter sp.]